METVSSAAVTGRDNKKNPRLKSYYLNVKTMTGILDASQTCEGTTL